MTGSRLLYYSMGPDVEAFTTMRDAELPYPVFCGHQVHGNKVGIVDREGMKREDFEGYDALITPLPVAIGVRTADCIPVLLYDPVRRVVAAIHAGWKGTVRKIVLNAISSMIATYKTDPRDLIAVIGPGIGFDSFQVGEEVSQLFKEAGFPFEIVWKWDGVPETDSMNGGHHIDLKAANKWLLMSGGVKEENIFISDIDTYTDERFFSARREGFECGRSITAIKLGD